MVEIKKKVWETFKIEVPFSSEISCEYNNTEKVLTIKGPKGEVSKILKFPRVFIKVENSKVIVGTEKFSKKEKKIIFTYKAHIKNMIYGVLNGYEYNLVILYAKFPMTVTLNGNIFTVKNLLGEKVPRLVTIPSDVKVVIKGKDITVTGIDKEKVGQVAASLEQSTRVLNMDRRIVQDGIFITKKGKREEI